MKLDEQQQSIQDFFEKILLAGFDLDAFNSFQDYIGAKRRKGFNLHATFCQYFDLGQGFLEALDLTDFPLEDWWEDYALRREF